MTPALLIRMWIGRPSSRRASPSAATDASDDRSSVAQRHGRVADAARGSSATAASPLRGLRTGRTTSAPAAARRGGDAEADAVAGAGDDGALAGEVGDGDVDGRAWHVLLLLGAVSLRLRPVTELIHGLPIRG